MIKILVVDDSRSIRELVCQILENAGYDVVTAEDGAIALEKAKAEKFDLVLTDLYMPEKSGIALLSSLRLMQNYNDVPVLMLTTEDSVHSQSRAKGLQANGWITKPFDATRLLTAIQKTLEKFDKS